MKDSYLADIIEFLQARRFSIYACFGDKCTISAHRDFTKEIPERGAAVVVNEMHLFNVGEIDKFLKEKGYTVKIIAFQEKNIIRIEAEKELKE